MKVAILITLSGCGGAQSHVFVLIKHLISEGVEVVLAVGDIGWLSYEIEKIGVKVKIIKSLVHPVTPYKDFMAVLEVRSWLDSEQPDCVHCHSSKAGLVGRVAAATLGIPSVFTAHGWAFTAGASLARKLIAVPLEKVVSYLTGKIICVSEYDYFRAVKFNIAPTEMLEVIHNGVDDSDYRSEGNNQIPVIVCVARFAPPKQHLHLIDTLARLSHKPWKLMLVGDGPEESKVVSQVKRAGLEDRIQFLGARDDVPKILSESDIFVLPSSYEGLPISIIEAMRAGLPVIASDVGGVSELVNTETGILVKHESNLALDEAILFLLDTPDQRQLFGRAGRQAYETYFRSSEMVRRYVITYQEVVEKSQK